MYVKSMRVQYLNLNIRYDMCVTADITICTVKLGTLSSSSMLLLFLTRAARTSSVQAPMSHTRLYIAPGQPRVPRQAPRPMNTYATSKLHPIGQPGELLPAGPHAELLFMVGVERRAGARGGHQSLHLVRVTG